MGLLWNPSFFAIHKKGAQTRRSERIATSMKHQTDRCVSDESFVLRHQGTLRSLTPKWRKTRSGRQSDHVDHIESKISDSRLTTAVDAEAQVEKEMLSSTPGPALPITPVYTANYVVPSDMQTFELDVTLTKRALNGALYVIAHSKEELNGDSIGKESCDKQMEPCCSKEPCLNNDTNGSSKCVIDKGCLNFSPCLVKLRRDGKLVQDASAIGAEFRLRSYELHEQCMGS